MTNNEIIKALKKMAAETGSLNCLGCGYEHNCSTHGCIIMRKAAARLKDYDELQKIIEKR